VLDIRDVITFKGETVAEAKKAFQDSVDDYFEFCQDLAQEPDKPFGSPGIPVVEHNISGCGDARFTAFPPG
jgi:hypothetical protein